MDRNKYIELAKEAGFSYTLNAVSVIDSMNRHVGIDYKLTKFAELLLAEQSTQVDGLVEALRNIATKDIWQNRYAKFVDEVQTIAREAIAAYEAKR